jgi:glycosyltransferase involved in cell wall biosynthesis
MICLVTDLISRSWVSQDIDFTRGKESARWVRRWSKREAAVICEGIDATKFRHVSDDRQRGHTILIAAYLSLNSIVRKSILTLLKAFRLMHAEIPSTKLVIVGENMDEKMDGYSVLAAVPSATDTIVQEGGTK